MKVGAQRVDMIQNAITNNQPNRIPCLSWSSTFTPAFPISGRGGCSDWLDGAVIILRV